MKAFEGHRSTDTRCHSGWQRWTALKKPIRNCNGGHLATRAHASHGTGKTDTGCMYRVQFKNIASFKDMRITILLVKVDN